MISPDVPGFADTARIRSSPETEALGLAGREGVVYGHTTPSYSHVEVIGSGGDDFAINVHFADLKRGYWFVPDLLEFVRHNPGTTMRLEGSVTQSVQQADGTWREVPADEAQRAQDRAKAPIAPLLRWLERFLPRF